MKKLENDKVISFFEKITKKGERFGAELKRIFYMLKHGSIKEQTLVKQMIEINFYDRNEPIPSYAQVSETLDKDGYRLANVDIFEKIRNIHIALDKNRQWFDNIITFDLFTRQIIVIGGHSCGLISQYADNDGDEVLIMRSSEPTEIPVVKLNPSLCNLLYKVKQKFQEAIFDFYVIDRQQMPEIFIQIGDMHISIKVSRPSDDRRYLAHDFSKIASTNYNPLHEDNYNNHKKTCEIVDVTKLLEPFRQGEITDIANDQIFIDTSQNVYYWEKSPVDMKTEKLIDGFELPILYRENAIPMDGMPEGIGKSVSIIIKYLRSFPPDSKILFFFKKSYALKCTDEKCLGQEVYHLEFIRIIHEGGWGVMMHNVTLPCISDYSSVVNSYNERMEKSKKEQESILVQALKQNGNLHIVKV